MTVDPGPFELGPVGGAGPAALCIHGLTGTPYEVRPPAEALARRGFACAGPLLPGHGSDPAALARTPRAAWLEAVLAAHDRLASTHKSVSALGLSLGGLLALGLAAWRPLAAAVVLAAPLRLPLAVRATVTAAGWLGGSLPKTPDIRDPEARARHPGYRRMPLRALRELVRYGAEVEAELGRVRVPLCLVYSRADRAVPLENARRIRGGAASSRCEVHVLERSGHVLPVDLERERVAQLAVAFLEALEGAPIDARPQAGLRSP